ncbi:MAG: hypothetical protein ACTIH7_05330 [Brevibacterium aurantiacum]|uniref:GNAT family N-acetyltransferase n=1 Tax=Brevibacterium aurantiacum TaxID=273384 RepID=A0A3Q9NSQ9_BREAU|nr:hypothetical protein [Brevibacterium aurantiacum]AZT94124.1 hypothetical protein CXR23_13990 [Brevibacterium aurantiacum]
MDDHAECEVLGTSPAELDVELVWGVPGGLGQSWEPVGSAAGIPGVLPPPSEVEELYAAAAAEPPLNEDPKHAALFGSLYDLSVRNGQVLVAATHSEGRLRSIAYGHFWSWAEQDHEWAHELRSTLGDAAATIEWSFALNLLARDPHLHQSGLGRATLQAWLAGISGYSCWLQTTDIDSPARRLYESLEFFDLGHGPEAPNGQPGLIMFRPPV